MMSPMSFDDLPDDWPQRPLSEPRFVADVLDLLVSEADRRAGALVVVMCDADGRVVQPVVVEDPDPDASEEERVRAIGVFVEAMGGCGSLLVALARRDGLSIRPGDRCWDRAVRRACGAQARVLGVHVVTLSGSRLVPAEEVAA